MSHQLVNAVILGTFAPITPPGWFLREVERGLGGVCLFGRHFATGTASATASRLATINPLLITTDEEGGDVTRIDAGIGSDTPGNAALGVVDDTTATRAVAAHIGHRLAGIGVTMDLAPVADVANNPDNPVIAARSFGADPQLVARHTAAYIRGLHDAGVAACVKHFPGHGDTNTDSHLGVPAIAAGPGRLRELEWPPFVAAVAAGVDAVMTAHVVVPEFGEAPATVNPDVIRALREELGFGGLIISDAVDMAGVRERYGLGGAAVAALQAGVDMICIGATGSETEFREVHAAISAAVLDGALPAELLENAAARVWGLVDAPSHIGAEVAARAIRTTGDVVLTGPPVLLEFDTPTTIAVGEVPWGLDGLLPGAAAIRLSELDEWHTLMPIAFDRPLVVVYRDSRLHPELAKALHGIGQVRPDAIFVAMGDGAELIFGSHTIRTFGAARVNAHAAAAVLRGERKGEIA